MSDEPKYRDRCDGYIPEPSEYQTELRITGHTLLGNPHQDRHITTRVPVAMALADELNRGPDYWFWAQVDPGSAETKEHWSRFDGWRIRVGVDLRTWNRREVNDWKGRDEIRKEGEWLLYFNEKVVYGGYVNRDDALRTLNEIQRISARLQAIGPIDWTKDDYTSQIEGRKVYYRDQPAVLGYWMPDQGCVMVHAAPGVIFKPRAYDIDNMTGTDKNPENNYSRESAKEAKVHLDSDDIWWWRDRLVPGEEK